MRGWGCNILPATVALFSLVNTIIADSIGTLKMYQHLSCADQVVALRCPAGTCISVQTAHYSLVSPNRTEICQGSQHSNAADFSTCRLPDAFQSVVETCNKQQHCKFDPSLTASVDPCPELSKYIEIVYKCRPYEFKSKSICENDRLHLRCSPNALIAVYSAIFGRIEHDNTRCPQPKGVKHETCLANYATETLMKLCHGKEECTVKADTETFGNPCRERSRKYLKVVYTCVPRSVLLQTTSPHDEEGDSEVGSPGAGSRRNAETTFHSSSNQPLKSSDYSNNEEEYTLSSSPTYFPQQDSTQVEDTLVPDGIPVINCTIAIYTNSKTRVIGFVSEWIHTYNFLSKNKEKLVLYLTVSISAGLLSLLTLVIFRLLWQQKYYHSSVTNTLPNGLADASDADEDIDLTSTMTVSILPNSGERQQQTPAEVVRYGTSAPRSMSRSGNSHYFYG